jgi:hypothetical protein
VRPGPTSLRVLAGAVLAAGVAGAVFLWLTAPDTVETTRRIVGHANLTFQDLEVRVSGARIALGFASLLAGVFLWAVGRVVADVAEALRVAGPGSERGHGVR